MSERNREEILHGLAKIASLGAKAEAIKPDDILRMTLPVRAHLGALDPDILLIVGERGAGKTHLFRVILLPDGPKILGCSGHASNAIWITGFSFTTTSSLPLALSPKPLRFPGESVLERFVTEHRKRVDLVDFWRGLLLGAVLIQGKDHGLSQIVQEGLPQDLLNTLTDLTKTQEWFPRLVQSLENVESALNRLDDELSRIDRYLIVTYDDLDVMAVEWDAKRALLQALLQFWLGQWRRWRRIRPKIFLRRDLFSPEFLQFPDASKLEGHKYELRWTPSLLYQLVFKLWANQNKESRAFLEESGLVFAADPYLGWTYPDQRPPAEEALRRVIHRLVGPFMGRGPKKGRSFEWIPNHLQDAKGEIFPRSMIRLFSEAANHALKSQEEVSETIMSPVSFAVSIRETSEQRIRELLEEYPWLESIRNVLQGQLVPMPQEQLADILKQVNWDSVQPTYRPPSVDANGLIEYMIKIGVLYRTRDGRIHVPDIYLYGFGLKRKGGIRRPTP